ncbi:MAG: hypothetical protein WCV70_02140 [Patescibacteria group bacterium]|jgi:hypothetical protein
MKSNKFVTDYFIILEDKNFSRDIGKWAVADLDKSKNKSAKFRYGKKLKDLLFYQEKIKRSVFFQLNSASPGFYLPVTIANPKTGQAITVLAVADSGASSSCFSHEIAEAIGINWKKGVKSKAFKGEKFTPLYVYQVKILMSLPGDKYFYEEKVDIINEKRSDNLLGMIGFFNHHQVIFDPKFGIKYKFITYGGTN